MLAALLAVVVLLAGWFLAVSPKRASADALRAQTAAQQVTNDGLKAKIAELQAEQKDLPKQQAIIADIQQRIPQNPDLPALIRQLSTMATQTNVDIHSVTPIAPTATLAAPLQGSVGADGQTLQVISVNMEVHGTYYNIERFFNKMESLKRSLLVNGVTINANTDPGTAAGSTSVTPTVGQSPQLAAIINFRAFMVSSLTAPGTSPLHSTTGTTGTTGATGTTSTPAKSSSSSSSTAQ
jgi:type IV pilus assembly protein PilO